jgi:hypothetical protein
MHDNNDETRIWKWTLLSWVFFCSLSHYIHDGLWEIIAFHMNKLAIAICWMFCLKCLVDSCMTWFWQGSTCHKEQGFSFFMYLNKNIIVVNWTHIYSLCISPKILQLYTNISKTCTCGGKPLSLFSCSLR